MLNTCSIGRRWKSREGWSRPVLTGERGTLFPTLAGRVSSCGGFLVGWQGTLFLVVTTTMLVRRLSFASVVRFPDRHDRNRSCGWFRFCRPPVFRLAVLYWFCGGHGPGETPGPFPNPEAKAWHGDGTALERVWESSAPPHSTVWTFWSSPPRDSRKVFFLYSLGGSRGVTPGGNPIFYAFFRCSLPVACGRLPFHNTPRITWSASVTVINDVMRLTRYVRAGSRESRYDGKRHKPDD